MNDLKEAFQQEAVVKRIHELENYIDTNIELKEKMQNLKLLQKQMVNAKEYGQSKQYALYNDEYQKLYQQILDYPFVEEYLDLLEEANQMLITVTNIIETKINLKLR
ncbi:MAG: YlbF family regulator [Anaeroplasmataceae bacterium]|nr:YlbF family regulator [Anaeroplasmataceae bacterium]